MLLFRAIFLSLICIAQPVSVVCQVQTPAQNQPDNVIKLTTDLVVLDAQITNKKTGRVITGLKKEDFELFEDGVKQEITHFSYDQRPLSIVFLIETILTGKGLVEEMQKAAADVLNRLKAADEIAILVFGHQLWLLQEFSHNRQRLGDKLTKLNFGDFIKDGAVELKELNGFSGIGEAIYQTDVYLQEQANPLSRRVMIVITENYPSDSHPPHSISQIKRQLLGSGTVVYGLVDDGAFTKVLKTIDMLPQYKAGKILGDAIFGTAGNVNTYAKPTSGKVMRAGKETVIASLAELFAHLREQYSFGYTSTNMRLDDGFRKIKLRLTADAQKRLDGTVIKTKSGYYVRKAETKAPQSKSPIK